MNQHNFNSFDFTVIHEAFMFLWNICLGPVAVHDKKAEIEFSKFRVQL